MTTALKDDSKQQQQQQKWELSLDNTAIVINAPYCEARCQCSGNYYISNLITQEKENFEASKSEATPPSFTLAKCTFDEFTYELNESYNIINTNAERTEKILNNQTESINPKEWFIYKISANHPKNVLVGGNKDLMLEINISNYNTTKNPISATHLTSHEYYSKIILKSSQRQKAVILNSLLFGESYEQIVFTVLLKTLGDDRLFDHQNHRQPGIMFCQAKDVLDLNELKEADLNTNVVVMSEYHIFSLILANSPSLFASKGVYSYAWFGLKHPEEEFEKTNIPSLAIVVSYETYKKLCKSAKSLRDEIFKNTLITLSDLHINIKSVTEKGIQSQQPKKSISLSTDLTLFRINQGRANSLMMDFKNKRRYLSYDGMFLENVNVCVRDQKKCQTFYSVVEGKFLAVKHFTMIRDALKVYSKVLAHADSLSTEDQKLIKKFEKDKNEIIINLEELLVEYLIIK